MGKAFWRGFHQGLTWPVSWPAMWICFWIGDLAFRYCEYRSKGNEPDAIEAFFNPRWWHVLYRTYNWGMNASCYWNDIGGFRLWTSLTPSGNDR